MQTEVWLKQYEHTVGVTTVQSSAYSSQPQEIVITHIYASESEKAQAAKSGYGDPLRDPEKVTIPYHLVPALRNALDMIVGPRPVEVTGYVGGL